MTEASGEVQARTPDVFIGAHVEDGQLHIAGQLLDPAFDPTKPSHLFLAFFGEIHEQLLVMFQAWLQTRTPDQYKAVTDVEDKSEIARSVGPKLVNADGTGLIQHESEIQHG